MSQQRELRCPKCEAPVSPDRSGEPARACAECGAVYRVVGDGTATRMIANPEADRGNVGRRLFVLAFLIFIAIVFGAMALYLRMGERG